MNRFATTVVLSLGLLVSSAGSAPAEPRSAAEVARAIGLSSEAIERVIAGEVVAEELEASSDKDLGLGVVMRLDAPIGAVSEFIDSDRVAQVQTVVLSQGGLDPAGPSLAEMTLPKESLARLVKDPGGTFSLSESEAARIESAARQGEAAALEAYRSVLAERASAYWKGGLDAIEPYAGKNRSPAADLRHANEAIEKLARLPRLQAELAGVPAESSGAVRHSLSWAVLKGRDIAAPVLIHRMSYVSTDGEIVVQRQFYSGYDYDALQIVVAILPTSEDWSAVFYTNHTYTVQVTGFGGSAKRSIGRKLLRKGVVEELERAQRAIPTKTSE